MSGEQATAEAPAAETIPDDATLIAGEANSEGVQVGEITDPAARDAVLNAIRQAAGQVRTRRPSDNPLIAFFEADEQKELVKTIKAATKAHMLDQVGRNVAQHLQKFREHVGEELYVPIADNKVLDDAYALWKRDMERAGFEFNRQAFIAAIPATLEHTPEQLEELKALLCPDDDEE